MKQLSPCGVRAALLPIPQVPAHGGHTLSGRILVYYAERLRVEQHLSTEKLQERYREAKDPVERSHYQVVWLPSRGSRRGRWPRGPAIA